MTYTTVCQPCREEGIVSVERATPPAKGRCACCGHKLGTTVEPGYIARFDSALRRNYVAWISRNGRMTVERWCDSAKEAMTLAHKWNTEAEYEDELVGRPVMR